MNIQHLVFTLPVQLCLAARYMHGDWLHDLS